MTSRDIVVAGALARHQMRQWLTAAKLEWTEQTVWSPVRVGQGLTMNAPNGTRFTVPDATEAQWGQIQEWVKKVTR